MHKDDRPIVLAIWIVLGTVMLGSMAVGGVLVWSVPYLLARVFG